jgi:uncharacterized membrane protein
MPVASSLYDWLLFLHVLAAMLWVGGVAVLSALAGRVLRSGDRAQVAHFIGNLRIIGPLLLAPPPAVLLGAGIWMVLKSWRFGQGWVAFGISLFAAAFLYGALFQSRAAIAAERAANEGDDEAAFRFLRRWSWGTRLTLLLLLVATWDMVLKPGL